MGKVEGVNSTISSKHSSSHLVWHPSHLHPARSAALHPRSVFCRCSDALAGAVQVASKISAVKQRLLEGISSSVFEVILSLLFWGTRKPKMHELSLITTLKATQIEMLRQQLVKRLCLGSPSAGVGHFPFVHSFLVILLRSSSVG